MTLHLPTMKFQKQAFRHDPENGIIGDCWRTAVACLLGIDRDSYPHLHVDGADLVELHRREMESRGIATIAVPILGTLSVDDALAVASTWSSHPFLFTGESRNGTNHVVVAHDGKIIHDPAIDDSGIIGGIIEEPHYYIAEWLVRHPARLPDF
jgi:hypothetical protein